MVHSKYSTNDSYCCSPESVYVLGLIKDMHAENSFVCSEKYGGICSIFFFFLFFFLTFFNLMYEAEVGTLQFWGHIWPHLFV